MDNDKSKIVFILSTGHSGSTLLGMLAGMHPSLWTLGEIHYLPNGLKEKRKCSCGRLIQECEWKEKLPKFYRYLLAPLNKLKF